MGSVNAYFIVCWRVTDDRDYDSWGEWVLDTDSHSVSSLLPHIVVSTVSMSDYALMEKLGGG